MCCVVNIMVFYSWCKDFVVLIIVWCNFNDCYIWFKVKEIKCFNWVVVLIVCVIFSIMFV